MTASQKRQVQISDHSFSSFNYPINGVEEKIYNVLCKEFRKYQCQEEINPVPLEVVYKALLEEYGEDQAEGQMTQGLAKLKEGKGGYTVIRMTDKGIMPGSNFGILR